MMNLTQIFREKLNLGTTVGLLLVVVCALYSVYFFNKNKIVFASSGTQIDENFVTASLYSYEFREEKSVIEYKKVVNIDDSRDACLPEETITTGLNGEVVKTVRTTYYDKNKQVEEVVDLRKKEPIDELVLKGGKKNFKTIATPDGDVSYWCKLENVLATSYDSTCEGCDTITATGMKQGFGVIAVDPKVIRLRSHVYVPGYGKAIAGDTGGMIKGKHIDLGYDSLMGQWSRRYVDVYLVD